MKNEKVNFEFAAKAILTKNMQKKIKGGDGSSPKVQAIFLLTDGEPTIR